MYPSGRLPTRRKDPFPKAAGRRGGGRSAGQAVKPSGYTPETVCLAPGLSFSLNIAKPMKILDDPAEPSH